MHLLLNTIGLALVLATLPLALELLALSIAAALPRRGKRREAGGRVRLAVIVPAHNEERMISACVGSIRSTSASDVTVYVVAHNCTDATADKAREAGAEALILNDTVGGKGTALDYGFARALGAGAEAVLVIDADSVAGPNLTAAVTAAFLGGAEALQARYEVSNAGASPRTRLAALAFLGMNVLRPMGRDRLGLSCGIFGNGFALSAETLRRVPYTANSLVEDLEYHLHLIRAGIRVEFLSEASVFGEMPEASAAAATQRARWEGGRILMRRQWTRPLLLEVLRGRGRMLEPLLDLLAFPLATEGALLVGALLFAVVARVHWLAVYSGAGILTLVLYVVMAAALGASPVADLRALAAAPGYLVWKLMMIPRTRRAARKDAAWVRTARNAEGEERE